MILVSFINDTKIISGVEELKESKTDNLIMMKIDLECQRSTSKNMTCVDLENSHRSSRLRLPLAPPVGCKNNTCRYKTDTIRPASPPIPKTADLEKSCGSFWQGMAVPAPLHPLRPHRCGRLPL